MAEVCLEGVSCVFRNRRSAIRAVEDLSLRVTDGEFMVLVGPSGCGKTTTLRVIAGLEEAASGTIRIGERIVNRVAPKDRDVAMVFQGYALYPHMTVFKNLAFGLKMRRVPKAEIQRKVEQSAATLGITHLLDRRPAALSGGEQQRVALGRAIVRQPKVFLFDEPLSNLDATLRLRMRAELKSLHRDLRATVVHVTHDQEEAMTLGDRIAVMNGGLLQQCGTPMEVYERPANRFVAGFIGTPPMNFFVGRLEKEPGGVCFRGALGRAAMPVGATVPGGAAGASIVMGLRPGHLVIGGAGLAARWDEKFEVRLIEPLGDCANVHLGGRDGVTFVARTTPSTAPRVGESVAVGFDPRHAHWFTDDAAGRSMS